MKHTLTTSFLSLSIGLTFLGVAPAFAHHSSAPHFDRDTQVEVTGRFKDFKFVNPHAYIYFDVDVDGVTQN